MKNGWKRFVNASCVKCDAINKEMIRIGAVIFCEDCAANEFSSDDPVIDERDKYTDWLHKWWKKAED